jgi:hypothetical protein
MKKHLLLLLLLMSMLKVAVAQSYDPRVNDAKTSGSLRRMEDNQRMERFQKGLEKSQGSSLAGPGIGLIFLPLINAIDRAEMTKWEYIYPLVHDLDGPRLSYKEAMVEWKKEKQRRKYIKKQSKL